MKKEITEKTLANISFILPTLLLGMWIISVFFMPERVALHFNMSGKVDRIGSSSEILLLGLVYYFIPIIMTVIFANIKAFWAKIIGLSGSIVVSIAYIGVSISSMISIFNASGKATYNGGLWASFAIAILGVALIIASHSLINIKFNIIFAKHNQLLTKNEQFNKINLLISIILFLIGLNVCLGCALIKNYYSFIMLFATIAVFGLIFFFVLKVFIKKYFAKEKIEDEI